MPRRWPRRCWPVGLTLVSGGTDNHLMLVDVTPLGIGGKLAEAALDACGITVNKNMIPFDERKPMDPSGIRIGTPALTTRGMGADEMQTDRPLDARGPAVARRCRRATSGSAARSASCASSFPSPLPRCSDAAAEIARCGVPAVAPIGSRPVRRILGESLTDSSRQPLSS